MKKTESNEDNKNWLDIVEQVISKVLESFAPIPGAYGANPVFPEQYVEPCNDYIELVDLSHLGELPEN